MDTQSFEIKCVGDARSAKMDTLQAFSATRAEQEFHKHVCRDCPPRPPCCSIPRVIQRRVRRAQVEHCASFAMSTEIPSATSTPMVAHRYRHLLTQLVLGQRKALAHPGILERTHRHLRYPDRVDGSGQNRIERRDLKRLVVVRYHSGVERAGLIG
jgi:hypothetical protein